MMVERDRERKQHLETRELLETATEKYIELEKEVEEYIKEVQNLNRIILKIVKRLMENKVVVDMDGVEDYRIKGGK